MLNEAFAATNTGSTMFEELSKFATYAKMDYGEAVKLVVGQTKAFGAFRM